MYGKTQFDLYCEEMRRLYNSDEWWGWEQVIEDFKEELWLLDYVFKWSNVKP